MNPKGSNIRRQLKLEALYILERKSGCTKITLRRILSWQRSS